MRGDAIPLPMRLLHVARDISLFLSAAGPEEARGVLERRSGRRVRAAARRARAARLRRAPRRARRDADVGRGAGDRAVPADLDGRCAGRRGLHGDRRTRGPQVALAPRALDRRGRPCRGGRLASGAPGSLRDARAAGGARARPRPGRRVERDLGEARAPRFRRMGTGPAPPALHGARLRPVAALAAIGVLAGSHHERLDGSGYHRGTRGPALDQAARILAAADCYAAMREARPYRPALDAGGGRGRVAARGRGRPARPGSGRRRARPRLATA